MAEKTPEQLRKEQEEARKHAEEQKKRDEAERQKHDQSKQGQQKGYSPSAPPPKTASGQHSKDRGGATVASAMTTYDSATGQPQDSRGGVEERSFTHDEIKGLAGDIVAGELAHLELDEEGRPNGVAFREIPDPDDVTALVRGTPLVQFDELVTPSGAPITKYMNPEPKLWDAGMLARNPPPEGSRPGDTPKGPVGGGVQNQPVAQ